MPRVRLSLNQDLDVVIIDEGYLKLAIDRIRLSSYQPASQRNGS